MLELFLALVPSLRPMDNPTSDGIGLLIESLASEDVEVREKSSSELRRLGESARARIEKAREHPDSEAAARARDLCEAIAFDQLMAAEVDLHTLTVAVRRVAQKEILWREDLGLRNRRIKIVSDVPLECRPEVLFKVYQAVLQIHDLALIPLDENADDNYGIRPCPVRGAGRASIRGARMVPEKRFITRVFSLQKVSSREAQAALINMATFPQNILHLDARNLLIATDCDTQIRQFEEILESMERGDP